MTNHSDEPRSDGKIIDLDWCVKFFEKRGQETYGPNFQIIPDDHEIIYKLVIYFLGHEDEAKRLGLDLRKGIMLTGPVGCGKTSLMSLMRLVPAKERNFMMKAARDISFEFIQEGYDVINRYSKLSFTGTGPRIYCFDDLGAEQNLKYYGNSCNVMGEIMLSRYDLFSSQGMVSHVTTNLGASEIEKLYGQRVRSRMREMLNIFSYPPTSCDKRK
jgi:energy-coupling factor transporter ATP-binding protein EcfA2